MTTHYQNTTIAHAMCVATALQKQNKLTAARKIIDAILLAQNAQPDALHLSGVIAFQSGEHTAGIEHIKQAIIKRPHMALFHRNLGEMYRQEKLIEDSIACNQHATALDPQSDIAWSNLAVAYYDAKKYSDAIDCHQRALALNPNLSASLNNLGSIYKALDNIQKATEYYQAAITASPNFIEPLNNIGVLYLEQEEFVRAKEYFDRVIQTAPTFSTAYCNVGLALLGLNHYSEALSAFKTALHYQPEYAEAYYGIAKFYLSRYDFIAAENAILFAISLDNNQAGFYQLLAEIKHEQNHSAVALEKINYALSLNPTSSNLIMAKGGILMETGEMLAAKKQFLCLTQDAKMDNRLLAHYSLVQLNKINFCHESFQALLTLENEAEQVSSTKLPYLYFALGKCFDDMMEHSKAFFYFEKGCMLKRKQINYAVQDEIFAMQKIMRSFTKEVIDELRVFANPSAVPIFIIGMPRSGGTLIEQILASHPAVFGAGELPYFTNLINHHHSTTHYAESTLLFSEKNCSDIAEQYLFYLRRLSENALYITDKMPYHFLYVGLIHALFPNAKIIHVNRHPLDTCLSCYTKLFRSGQLYSYDLIELGQYYRGYQDMMKHWRSVLPSNTMLEIEYEEIIRNFETQAKKIINYCQLDWHPACAAFYQSKRAVRTASFAQVRQPIYVTSINRWQQFKNELGPLMTVLG